MFNFQRSSEISAPTVISVVNVPAAIAQSVYMFPEAPEGDLALPEGDPAAPEGDSEAPDGGAEAPEGDPEAVEGDPEAVEGDPEAVQGDPEAVQGDPAAVQGDPEAVQGGPEALQGDPECHYPGLAPARWSAAAQFSLAAPANPAKRPAAFLKTVLEVITATTDYFAKSGVESPRLNIEHLLAHVLGKKRMELYMEFDRPLSDAELNPLRDLVKRRAGGEPLQYLLGTAEFLSHNLLCDKRALIPRPETEQLCEMLIAEAKAETCTWKAGRIVDVGTGSGCIALALAAALPEATVFAVDTSADALSLARENAVRVGLAERITFLESDLLERVDGPLSLVVANLPYIPSAKVPALQREVLREPHAALDGGEDGLVIVRRLVAQASQKIAAGGRLALELHFDHPSKFAPELVPLNFHTTRIVKDYGGLDRFVLTTHG